MKMASVPISGHYLPLFYFSTCWVL
uniref:Uncharacterized protein n=1 Tax=Arundo donax TaxID=35708 RepID=A0A0A9B1V7_ARUDO